MCHFKSLTDEESDDEDMVQGVIFQNVGGSTSESESSSDDSSDNVRAGREPRAGPSSAPDDPEWEPGDIEDEDASDEEEDDPLVQAIKSAKTRPQQHPPEIVFKNHVTDLSFHPGEDLLAVASVTGDIFVYKYSLEQCELAETLEVHSKACRVVEYGEDGNYLVSCGKEKSIMVTDTSTSKLLQFYDDAHESAPYALYMLNQNVFCSGDEDGVMKVWDVRQKSAICSFKVGDEQISSIISNDAGKHVVCCSSDCITAYDMHSRKLFVQSEPYEAELTSMNLFKQGQKLVVGTVKGSLYVFNWGQFGYHSDVYPGPKHNINTMVAITENIMVTGCGDGNIRAANLFPHKQLGVVGQHVMSVEATDIAHDGEYIASIGFDESVKFWDIRYFENVKVKPEKTRKADAQNNLPSSKIRNPGDFFTELS